MSTIGRTWEPIEICFRSTCSYRDPFSEIEMDLIVRDENGREWKVPCFWAGGEVWKARFSAPHVGEYSYTTICTDAENIGLNGAAGGISVKEYEGENPLYIHGPIEIMPDNRHFMYHDGTPFPWLGDTWWPLDCSRVNEDDEIRELTRDRVEKGFNLVHIVNGLWCDVAPFDSRLSNAAGFAWTEDYGTINPEYFNIVDKKMQAVADAGLVMAIAMTWGFYIRFMGVEKLIKHARYTIARYGAYSTIWLTAGEAAMPFYDYSEDSPKRLYTPELYEEVIQEARTGWTEVLRYIKATDPFGRLTTVHTTSSRITTDDIDDPSLPDFIVYQAGSHDGDRKLVSEKVAALAKRGLALEPKRPVLNAETCYEGMLYQCGPELQRWLFWHAALNGTAGWTYGACGIFNMSHDNDPFGACYYRVNWGEQSWQEAIRFDGAKQVGASRKYLNRYEWWKITPAEDITEDPADRPEYEKVIAGRIGDDLIVSYMQRTISFIRDVGVPYVVKYRNLTPGITYMAKAYNPIRDYEIDLGTLTVQSDGRLTTPVLPVMQDWAIFLQRAEI